MAAIEAMECGGMRIMKLQECLKTFRWCGVGAEGPIHCRNQSYVRDLC